MIAIPQELLESPVLPEIAERINALLREESARREKFRAELDEKTKAEFINGEAIVWNSPVKMEHSDVVLRLASLLKKATAVRGGKVQVEKALVACRRNDYEPDVCYWPPEVAKEFSRQQQLFPPPALICEVLSPSTAKNDRGIKFRDYAAHEVGEYWIVDPKNETIEQYLLEGGSYTLARKLSDGHIELSAIPGLVLEARALFDDAAWTEQLARLA